MAVISDHCQDIKVTLVDTDSQKIKAWNSDDPSRLPIYEPGLQDVVLRNRGNNLFFSTDIKNSIREADMIFISVNTPTKIKGLGAGYASDLSGLNRAQDKLLNMLMGIQLLLKKVLFQ